MNKLFTLVLLSMFSLPLTAHSNEDPMKDLAKSRARLQVSQQSFDTLTNRDEQYENLLKQVKYLQTSIFVLRSLIVKDYSHVKVSMSKYKLDYIAEVDKSLKSFHETLEQMKDTMDE